MGDTDYGGPKYGLSYQEGGYCHVYLCRISLETHQDMKCRTEVGVLAIIIKIIENDVKLY